MSLARWPLVTSCFLLLALSESATGCNPAAPYHAEYDVYWGTTKLGRGSISQHRLESESNEHCLMMNQVATPRRMLAWLTGEIREQSTFCIDENSGQFVPRTYRYEVRGNADKSYELTFSQNPLRVEGGDFGRLELDAPALDPLMLQAELRRWLCEIPKPPLNGELASPTRSMPVVKRRGVSVYQFGASKIVAESRAADDEQAWLVQRLDSAKRELRFWIEPAHKLIIRRAEFNKKGERIFRMELTGFKD